MPIHPGFSALATDASKTASFLGVEKSEKGKYVKTLYHGTEIKNVNNIFKKGLDPNKSADYIKKENEGKGQVHVATDPDDAAEWVSSANKGGAVIHVDRNHPSVRGFKKGYSNTNGHFYTNNHIYPEAVIGAEISPDNHDRTKPSKNNHFRINPRYKIGE